MLIRILLCLVMFFSSCGTDVGGGNTENKNTRSSQSELETQKLRAEYQQLVGTIAQISGLLNNDFTTCSGSLDSLIQNICRIAQDANLEDRNKLKSELLSVIKVLKSQVDATSNESGSTSTLIQSLNDSLYGAGNTSGCVQANTCDSGSIAGRLKTAENSITSINNLLSSVQTTVNRTLESIEIGVENLAAGPGYESVTRRVDRTQINGYIEAYGSALSISSNGATATNNSSTITVTTSSVHGLSVGQTISLSGLTAGKGFSAGNLTGLFSVVTVPTTSSFTISLSANATSGGSFGGSLGLVTPVVSRGQGTVWKTSDGEQSKVSVGGHINYNFLVTGGSTVLTTNPDTPLPTGWGGAATPGSGFICYSKSSATASAATIKSGGTSIVCK
jgi:hypothetical protein